MIFIMIQGPATSQPGSGVGDRRGQGEGAGGGHQHQV